MANPMDLYMQGLLGGNYQSLMQSGLLGATQAMAPLAGVRNRRVGMGEALAAAAGGAMQGQQRGQMMNMAGASQIQQMEAAKAQMAAAKLASDKAAQLTQYGAMMAQRSLVAGKPEEAMMWKTQPGKMMGHLQKMEQVKAKPATPQHSGAYKWAVDMGLTPGTPAFKTSMEQYESNKGTKVNVDLGDKGAALAPGASDHIAALWTQIDANTGLQDQLAATTRLAAKTPTGAGAEWANYARQWGAAFGMDVDLEKITNFEQFKVRQMDFVMDRIAGTKGSVSEKEMDAFTQAGPNLANTAAGNVIISKVMNEQARRENELAMMEIDLLNRGKTRTEARQLTEAKRQEFRHTPHLSDDEVQYIISQGQASTKSGGGGVITLNPDGTIQ